MVAENLGGVGVGRNKVNYSLCENSECKKRRIGINISSMRRRVENTTRSGVFLTNFEVFHLVMKHCDNCLILLLKRNDFRSRN